MSHTLLAGKRVVNGQGMSLFESRSKARCLRWADENVSADWGKHNRGEISFVDWGKHHKSWTFWRKPRYEIIRMWPEAL